MLIKCTILVCFIFFSQFAIAEIYKWVDEEGAIHFTDTPPKDAKTKKVKIKVNTYKSVQVIRPKTKVASIKKSMGDDKTVIMYSAEWCGVCRKAKHYFKEKNIAFTEYDIDKNKEAKQKYKLLNARGIPVIFIDEVRLNGFSKRQFERVFYN